MVDFTLVVSVLGGTGVIAGMIWKWYKDSGRSKPICSARMEHVEKRCENIESKQGCIEGRVVELEKDSGSYAILLRTYEESQGRLEASMKESNARWYSLEGRFSRIESASSKIEGGIDQILKALQK